MAIKYTREAILASDLFAEYQKDFLSAILTKDAYTIAEARRVVSDFFCEKKEAE